MEWLIYGQSNASSDRTGELRLSLSQGRWLLCLCFQLGLYVQSCECNQRCQKAHGNWWHVWHFRCRYLWQPHSCRQEYQQCHFLRRLILFLFALSSCFHVEMYSSYQVGWGAHTVSLHRSSYWRRWWLGIEGSDWEAESAYVYAVSPTRWIQSVPQCLASSCLLLRFEWMLGTSSIVSPSFQLKVASSLRTSWMSCSFSCLLSFRFLNTSLFLRCRPCEVALEWRQWWSWQSLPSCNRSSYLLHRVRRSSIGSRREFVYSDSPRFYPVCQWPPRRLSR